MPKQGQRADVNTFVQGLITEASPLNFPPNASIDEANFELNRDGSRNRRLGMDFEAGGFPVSTGMSAASIASYGINTYRWESVSGVTARDYLVAQVGNSLFFFDLAVDAVSAAGYKGTVSLSFSSSVRYSFTTVEGRLIVAAGDANVAAVSYYSPTFTTSYYRLRTRDIWGVEEVGAPTETDPNYRPDGTTMTNGHKYNLVNQGWGVLRKDKASGYYVNPLQLWTNALSKWPSNSEDVWSGMQMIPGTGTADPYEAIIMDMYDQVRGAKSSSAKGFLLIDLLDRGSSRASAFATNGAKYTGLTYGTGFYDFNSVSVPTDSTPGGAKCVSEFAGRAFYAGFSGQVSSGDARSPNLTNYVAFSQLVRSNSDLGNCFQSGDPTSRDSSEVVDTDGGLIRISGAKEIVALRSLEQYLVVIATNGVWTISGDSNSGFSATSFKVNKVSSFGGLSDSSVTLLNGMLVYLGPDAIYSLTKNQFGELGVQSLSATTIQSLYDEISLASKQQAYATYDQFSKKIKWIYKDGTQFTNTSVTKELVFDTIIKAFYINTFGNVSSHNVELYGGFYAKYVTVDSGYYVQSLKYLTLVKNGTGIDLYISHFNNTGYVDFQAYDGVGVDAKAYLVTGAQTAADSAIDKQIPYLVMHFLRTESGSSGFIPLKQSSCLVRSMWDWADSAISKKWSSTFQAYRYTRPLFILSDLDTFDNGFEVISSKSKIRGRGKAFSLYMETEAGKDCRLLGWNLTINGNAIA